MSNDGVPSVWAGGYVHSADVKCPSCRGDAVILIGPGQICVCAACDGKGTVRRGCGSPGVEIDAAHPGLGAFCPACGRTVPLEETARVGET